MRAGVSRESRQHRKRLKKGYLREENQLVKRLGDLVVLVCWNGLTWIDRIARFGVLAPQQSLACTL